MAWRLQRECEASVVVHAPVQAVWDLVSDVTRTGEWSIECRGAEWLGGATAASPGARFRGRNRRNTARWARQCEVLEVDAPHRLAWRTLPTRLIPDSTIWEFELAQNGSETTLTERMQVVHCPAFHDRVFATMFPQHRDRKADLQADLQRIKHTVEASSSSTAA